MWDIWPRDCREQLAAFLRTHADEFAAEGLNINPPNILHPIHDQVINFPAHLFKMPCGSACKIKWLQAGSPQESLPFMTYGGTH